MTNRSTTPAKQQDKKSKTENQRPFFEGENRGEMIGES
jgi:hypothetical protein